MIQACSYCDCSLHHGCLHDSVIKALELKHFYHNTVDISKMFLYFLDQEKYKQQIQLQYSNENPVMKKGDIVVYDKHTQLTGFVQHRWPRRTLLNSLILSNMGYTDSGTVFCLKCNNQMYFYGRESAFDKFERCLNKLKYTCILLPICAVGLGAVFFTLFSLSTLIISSFGWLEDFFEDPQNATLTDLLRLLAVPHFTYTLLSTRTGPLNVLCSAIYSNYLYGVPAYGITKHLQKFMRLKFLGLLIYRLTINRYFFESFKRTIPALFGTKLSIEDAWAIQEYRNQIDYDEEYSGFPLWRKIRIFLSDTVTCIWKDFKQLYQTSEWKCSEIVTFFISLLAQNVTFLDSPFYTDSQNRAYTSFVTIVVLQCASFCISTYNAIKLCNSFNSLQTGKPTGCIDNDAIEYVFSKLMRSFVFRE